MKTGQIFSKFKIKDGREVLLRAVSWEDLDPLLKFAEGLVDDRELDPDFGILLDKRPTREFEAEFLAKKVVAIENGNQISVVAIIDGNLVGNSDVERGSFSDEFHHGKLGIAIARDFRNLGIGSGMMKTLVEQSRKAGLKTIELEVFANNQRALHMYERAGFRVVGKIPKKIFRKDRFIDIIVMSIEL